MLTAQNPNTLQIPSFKDQKFLIDANGSPYRVLDRNSQNASYEALQMAPTKDKPYNGGFSSDFNPEEDFSDDSFNGCGAFVPKMKKPSRIS